MPALTREDDVFVLNLGDGENRFTLDWLTEVEAALDEVTAAEGPRALVTTAGGRFFSNGLDLDWLLANPDVGPAYTDRIEEVFARLLSAPLYTVAALPGHAFGGGAMLALAHDSRVMRADRGYWSLPEAALGLPFMPGMAALIQARLPQQTAHEAMVTSRRYGGTEAQAAGIVDVAVEAEAVRATAVDRAAGHAALAGPNLAGIKTAMYAQVLAALRSPRP
ncbi:enoyl-CoA hydratase/isomerase family protein [Blastococcus sp. TF02A-26]|uniref:enoyl-CoA hydratase/isomerase family protein n=1 Tax=Blastococcus sp. TF02A-26 TaxID=2250577 RepID=UPI000DE879FB|nr:enoyl-CoA hydratase/isomerase family protein [Blastococcus sp. TF02A-26]RBY81921.1 enoyl-CoA hydratase/isomerase family protein [Blastococcus sp. TF02A-26]